VAGLSPDRADLVVGTSAGSVVAAYVRSGWSTAALWEIVVSSDLPPTPESGAELEGLPPLFRAAFRTPLDVVRRGLGSAYVVSRTTFRAPLPALPAPLRRAFPGGIFLMAEGRRRFESELPAEWPDRPTWLCAVDIVSGRRIVLGRRRPPRLTLPEAVMASCAIPGAYPPVRYGRRELIDGGAHSTTNLDLAGRDGCDVIVGVVPMAYREDDPPGLLVRATRRLAHSALAREVAGARRRGAEVILVRPSAAEASEHGVNLMRSGDLAGVARAAYESTARLAEAPEVQRALDSGGSPLAGGGSCAPPPGTAQGRGRKPTTTL
jgi:NTE family protein